MQIAQIKATPPPLAPHPITGPAAFSWNGTYHLYNPLSQNSVPEPGGGCGCLGLGLSALVFQSTESHEEVVAHAGWLVQFKASIFLAFLAPL